MDLTLSRLARPRKEENALSRYNFGHTRKTWGREGKGRETEWFRARGSSLGKETIESLSFFSRLSLFFPFLSPREIYVRDVREFDKLRDCRRRFKDIRAKVFTSFSAGFQILFFLPRILVLCIVRVGLWILKKKWGGFLAKKISQARNIIQFTHRVSMIEFIHEVYGRKVGGSIRFAFCAARLHIFTRGKVIAHRHLPRLAHCL